MQHNEFTFSPSRETADALIVEFRGHAFICRVESDDGMYSFPWVDYPDSMLSVPVAAHHRFMRSDKRPGQVILSCRQSPDCYLYDWQAAVKHARTNGWHTPPHRTQGQSAVHAVKQEVAYIDAWLNDERWWAKMHVRRIDTDHPDHPDYLACTEPDPPCFGDDDNEQSAYGLDVGCTDLHDFARGAGYLVETARELVRECWHSYLPDSTNQGQLFPA